MEWFNSWKYIQQSNMIRNKNTKLEEVELKNIEEQQNRLPTVLRTDRKKEMKKKTIEHRHRFYVDTQC